MISLTIVAEVERDGFGPLRDLSAEERDAKLIHLTNEIQVGALEGGMVSGKPSAAFCFELPDGKVVIAETSLALLLTAADVLKARYGDPRS